MSLTEEAVGMAPVQAQVIECVFRERYSDFVVREVGPDGAVARVVAEAPPADAPDEAPAEEEAAATAAASRRWRAAAPTSSRRSSAC